ncbi:MAG: hypothetical protein HY901_06540, partial [Deltaproteobacteria bacterium]|nr:hypothetical protein [Deltaproteobacteria bacterium]
SLLERALADAQEQSDQLTVAEATVYLGACLSMLGEATEGAALCAEGARLAQQSGLREAEMAAHLHLWGMALARGDADAARSCADRCQAEQQDYVVPLFRNAYQELCARHAAVGAAPEQPH